VTFSVFSIFLFIHTSDSVIRIYAYQIGLSDI